MANDKVDKDEGKKQSNGTRLQKESGMKTSSSSGALLSNILIVLLSFAAGILSPHVATLFRGKSSIVERSLMSVSSSSPSFSCTEETLSQFLHDVPVPGLHVVCWEENKLTFYKNARVGTATSSVPAPQLSSWNNLRSQLVQHLGLRSADSLHQPWATYTPVGERSRTEVDPDDAPIDPLRGMFLLFQGGQWIWPGVRKGFRREIQLNSNRNATLETISIHPLVLSVQGFLGLEECALIQKTAAPSLQYSGVTLMDQDHGRPASDFRTSQTTFLTSWAHPFLKEIEERTASLVRVPASHQEDVQVLRYGHGEKYDSHHDYFNPALYQNDPGTQQLIAYGLKNRMITVFWYLSDVAAGGETSFPSFDKGHVRPPYQCEEGSGALLVKPQVGKVIIFYSQTPDGAMDEDSLHGACPVKEGIKWAANKWVWNLPLGYDSG